MKTNLSAIITTARLAAGRWFIAGMLLSTAGVRAAEPVFVDVTPAALSNPLPFGSRPASWVDYDNDGRLDFLLGGYYWGVTQNPDGSATTYPIYLPPIWRNTGSGFTNLSRGLPDLVGSATAWGDYDNDGRVDLLLGGQIWRNTESGFTNMTALVASGLPGADAVAWGDYDNDGRLDFLLTGGFLSQVWRNNGTSFSNVTDTVAPGLTGVAGGAVAWGDYDNDGRLDFLLTGGIPRRTDLDDDYPYYTPIAQLWRNTGSGFENVTGTATPGLEGVFWGAVEWADFNNDGRLDFMLTGAKQHGGACQFWRNTGTGFSNVTAAVAPGFPVTSEGSVAWGDYDNDGWIDLLITGGFSQIWRNTGGTFTNVTAAVAPALPRVFDSQAAWGDYDNDGRLDILIAGATSYYCDGCDPPSHTSRLLRNSTGPTNAPPLVITKVPASASQTSIALNASIHPHRQAVTGWFLWGNSTNYGQVTAAQPVGSGDSFTNCSQTISGLSTGVTYYYRAVGSNEQGQVALGVEQRFSLVVPGLMTTPPRDPATMTAAVIPNNLPTYGWFEWGTTPGYGQVTPIQFLGNGFDASLWQNLPNPQVGTTYYYRAVVSNGVGVVYGAAQSLVAAQLIVRCPLGFLWPDFRTHGYSATGGDVHFWIGCDWTAINTNEWITITSATNGPAGYGAFTYSVAHNISREPRHGNITIGGHNVSMTQRGGVPLIVGQPTNQTVLAGETVTLSVAVAATEPVNYQWYRLVGSRRVPVADGNGISGATSSNLVFTGVQASQAGMYLAETSGGRSSWARLEVLCNFSFSATQATFSSLSATGSVTVNAAACDWSIVNENPWVTILSAINNKGSGTVVYVVVENPSAALRTGEIIIADRTFTITQDGGGSSPATSLSEALDTEGVLTWSTVGTPAWFGQRLMSHDGVDAAQSGAISNSAAVTAQSIITGPGTLSFWWKVSSETNKDFLKFFVNGVQQTRISGEVGWEFRSYAFPSGTYTSKWTYSKNATVARGQDRGWLDQVAFVAGPGCVVTLSHTNVTHYSGSEAGEVSVTAAGGCTWDVFTLSPWITAVADLNNGLVRYTVAATTADRTGVLFIAGQPFTILQRAMSGPPVFYSHGAVEAWVRRHNGHADSQDYGGSMAIDSSGNVIVVGTSDAGFVGGDWLIIKYSSAGVPLWTNRYNGPANNDDRPNAVAVDGSDNVFVTGYSRGSDASYGFATIKYSGTGVPLWTNRCEAQNHYNAASFVAVDGQGKAFVSGVFSGDYITIAYSGGGVPLWTNRYDGPANGHEYPEAIAVNSSGNVFVTGLSDGGTNTSADFATVAYSSAGVPLWTNRYDGLNDDWPMAMAVDLSGNVFVTGQSARDYATVAYSGAGRPLWTNLYETGFYGGGATAIAVDGHGDVVVTGYSHSSGLEGADYATIKYSGAGVPLWERRFNAGPVGNFSGGDLAYAVAVDDSGNVLVTGRSTGIAGNVNPDYLTIKYSSAGDVLWINRYNGLANDADDVSAMAVDSNGNVFVTGSSIGSGGSYDCTTLKYSAAGGLLWQNRYNGGGGNSDDQANAVAVDSRNGNVFVTGSSPRVHDPSHDTTIWNAGADYTTIAYSSAGVPLWTNFYNGPGNSRDEAVAVALDSSGNVFVTGFSYQGGVGNYARDYATIKYSGAGVPLWTNRYIGSDYGAIAMVVDSSGDAIVTGNSATIKYSGAGVLLWMNRFGGEAAAVAVDGSGNVFVTGHSVGSDGWAGYATVKYSRAGVPLWTNHYKGPGNFGESGRAVAVDGHGDVFVTGYSSGSSNSYDYATLKYSGDGVLLWARRYNRGYGHSMASALAVDGSGDVIVTGYSTTSDGYQDYATIKYSGTGVTLWTNHFGGPGISSDLARAVAVDWSGDVFVTGKSSDSHGGDYATIKYSAAGVPLWMKRYNGPANRDDSPRTRQSLALGPDGSVYVTGGSDGSPYDFATVKYVSVPLLTIRRSAAHIMVLWPSLFSGFTLQQNNDLNATANWSPVAATVEDDGTNRAVVVSPPTGNRFYRLAKP